MKVPPIMTKLFENGSLGDIQVKNRVFMAPLTRNRAHGDGTPHEMAVKYYTQRASAGLIVTEGAQISPEGQGYINTPGIYNEKQKQAWAKINRSVHAEGGKMVVQLWHVGRISHNSLLPEGSQPVAPSAIQATADTFTDKGVENASPPKALDSDSIKGVIADYVQASRLAIEAGFDGVEVHAANGYLLNQFISAHTNVREDEYGGSPENRARLLLEVVDAIAAEVGIGRVGVRVSPTGTFNDFADLDAAENYRHIYKELGNRNLAYLHVVESFPGHPVSASEEKLLSKLRRGFSGNYIANGNYDKASASEILEKGSFAVSFGRPYIANPDLVERLRGDAKLNEVDEATLYGGDEKGYSDYPTRDEIYLRTLAEVL